MTIEEALEWAKDTSRSAVFEPFDANIALGILAAEVERLREDNAQLKGQDTCCCGSPYKDHANGAQGHDFVSLYWYTLDQERSRAEAAEKELAAWPQRYDDTVQHLQERNSHYLAERDELRARIKELAEECQFHLKAKASLRAKLAAAEEVIARVRFTRDAIYLSGKQRINICHDALAKYEGKVK